MRSKDKGGSQRDKDSSPSLSFNSLKQREIEIEEGSARVSWYETQLLIGQPNGGSPKLFFFLKLFGILKTQNILISERLGE